MVHGGEEQGRRKVIFGEGTYLVHRGAEKQRRKGRKYFEKEKEENIWSTEKKKKEEKKGNKII